MFAGVEISDQADPFWAFDRVMGNRSDHVVLFLDETPSGESIKNLKEASVGGSSVSAAFGIKLKI